MNKGEKIRQKNLCKKELLYSISTILILLSLVMSLNAWCDPEGVYRPRYASFQRIDGNTLMIEAMAAKYFPANAVILGSSLSHRAEILDQSRVWGESLVNLAGAHNHAAEQKEAAKQSIANGTKVIMWELMLNIMKPPDMKKDTWVYTPTIYDQLYYLRDASTLRKSLLVMLGGRKVSLSIDDFSEYHRCPECIYGFNGVALTTPRLLTVWNKGNRFEDVTEISVLQALGSLILPVIRENPEVTFKFFLPPISLLGSIEIDKRMKSAGFSMAQYRGVVFRNLIDEPNVEIYDFQSESHITENLENYSDLIHYDPGINTKLVSDMRSGKVRLTRESAAIAVSKFDSL